MRRTLLALAAFVLVLTACADDAGTTTTTPATTTTLDDVGFQRVMDELVAETEALRGIEFIEDPVVTILSEEELAERVREQIEEDLDPEELAVYQRLLEILGLLDGTVDLGQAYLDLYAEQVGGFYDHETREMVVQGGSSLSPLSRSIVVHELIHALTDQHYGFAQFNDDLIDAEEFEHSSAIRALAEGDALYFQLLYLQTLSVEEQTAAIQESLDVDSAVLDSLPDWFGEDLTFPYDYGYGLVERLVSEGGMTLVNQAYERLPQTTEQILHPEKYSLGEVGREVALPAYELGGYTVFEEAVWGEWNTQLLLLDGVQPGEAVVAAAGWGGDQYRIYTDNGVSCEGADDCLPAVALVLLYEGDTPRDAEELSASIALSVHNIMKVGSARPGADGVTTYSGGEDYAFVQVSGNRVLFIAADDPAVGRELSDFFRL